MSEIYEYLYTKISISGSLPTYKVFSCALDGSTKWVFADNTFIYGHVSDWSLKHAGLDSGKASWSNEPKLIQETEKRKLAVYKASHLDFKTEFDVKI